MISQRRVGEIEKQELNYLSELEKRYNRWSLRAWLGRPRYLWLWQKNSPLFRRWEAIISKSLELRKILSDSSVRTKGMSVLDLGCGFGMYWPIFREFGFREFVGIDLFDLRRKENYFDAAKKFVKHFCFDCKTQLIMDDARNLGNYNLIADKFDIILAVATTSAKIGSTVISEELFNDVVNRYGKEGSIKIFVEGI